MGWGMVQGLRGATWAIGLLAALAPASLYGQCVSEASAYGINAHAPQGAGLPVLLNEVQACGIGWIRVDFVWAWVEPSQDSFDWSMYDSIVAAANARGLHIYATIGHTPAWATTGSEGIGVPTNAADFYDICYRAAQRYQASIHYWGLWNEPNLSQFWAGTQAQYIELILKNGADAIHAAATTTKACGPELAHLSSGSWDTWLTECINQAGTRLDVVTHHGYSSSGYSGVTDKLEKAPFWPWDPPSVKQVLQNTGWYGKPFWLTETGWESANVGETNQANYYTGLLTDWFTGQPSRSWVHKIFFYELNDTQAFANISFGILGQDPTYARKPAFTAYQAFIAAHPASPAAPAKTGSPVPANLATAISTHPALTWASATCANSYDVYFGTSSPGIFVGNQTAVSFSPGALPRSTTFYWRVDAVNGSAKTTGDVWRFVTETAPGDFDLDGDVDQSDFSFLQICISGRGEAFTPPCSSADLDGEGDVDDLDVTVFLGCMGGAEQVPGC